MAQRPFKFLIVADGTPESRPAAWFAALRAAHTGACVAILSVIEPHGFEHWLGVGEEIRREAREAAEQHLEDLSAEVRGCGVEDTEFIIREGDLRAELQHLIEEDRDIRILVLGSAAGANPGPLVSAVARGGRGMFGQRAIPIAVVPGVLTRQEIEEIA
ncbi:MAG: universal stress protein [Maricaulaceae bacterium]